MEVVSRIAFPYYGGKNTQLSWLLPLLPYAIKYIEPYGGSAAVLLNRARSTMEIYNDLDHTVVNFFRVLRDRGPELIEKLRLTPFARYEHDHCLDPTVDELEAARRFFVKSRQTFMTIVDAGTWAAAPTQIRRGVSQVISRWLSGIEGLMEVVERLRLVVIEDRPAIDVIEKYDDEDAVMYCDPPYYREVLVRKRGYACEMTEQDHSELLDCLMECKGAVAISGYDNDLYNDKLKKWFRYEDRWKRLGGDRTGIRQEILWCNYDPMSVRSVGQSSLGDYID